MHARGRQAGSWLNLRSIQRQWMDNHTHGCAGRAAGSNLCVPFHPRGPRGSENKEKLARLACRLAGWLVGHARTQPQPMGTRFPTGRLLAGGAKCKWPSDRSTGRRPAQVSFPGQAEAPWLRRLPASCLHAVAVAVATRVWRVDRGLLLGLGTIA